MADAGYVDAPGGHVGRDEHPDGPGFIEVAVPSDVQGDHPVRKQFVDTGNAVMVEDAAGRLALTDSVSIVAIVFPTTPLKGRQLIMGRFALDETAGYALGIDKEGHLAVWVGDGKDTDEIVSTVPLVHHTWYLVGVSYNARSGEATLHHEAIVNPYSPEFAERIPPPAPQPKKIPVPHYAE